MQIDLQFISVPHTDTIRVVENLPLVRQDVFQFTDFQNNMLKDNGVAIYKDWIYQNFLHASLW